MRRAVDCANTTHKRKAIHNDGDDDNTNRDQDTCFDVGAWSVVCEKCQSRYRSAGILPLLDVILARAATQPASWIKNSYLDG